MRGYVRDFAEYQQDVQALVSLGRRLLLPEPWHLLAHSMGGCIGLRALLAGLPVQSAVFTAPMWGVPMSPPLRLVAWTITALAPALGQGLRLAPGQSETPYLLREPFEGNSLTSDRAMWDYMRAQMVARPELALAGATLGWLGAALREMRALAALPSPQVPTLTYLGDDEAIVDSEAIVQRMAHWPRGELLRLPQARHEVLMEGPAIRARIMARLQAHFASAGG